MSKCEHLEFAATVNVHRLTDGDDGPVTGFLAEVRISCQACGRKMQFRGLPAGIDTGGACVSVDGLEARLGIAPQFDELSYLDRIAAVFRDPTQETH